MSSGRSHQRSRSQGSRGGPAALAALLSLANAGVGCRAAAIGVVDGAEPPGCQGADCSGAAGSSSLDAGPSRAPDAGRSLAPQPASTNLPPLVPCGPLPLPLIDNFDSGDMSWYLIDDGLGVRTFLDGIVIEPGGPGSSSFVAHTAGSSFSNWGAFVETQLPPIGGPCVYDVRAYAGVRFAVRAGGTASFRVELPTLPVIPDQYGGTCVEGCGDFHGRDLRVPLDTWVECSVRFGDLHQEGYGAIAALDLENVQTFRIHFTNTDQPFDLLLDDVEFVPAIGPTGCRRLAGDEPAPGDAGTADAG